MREVTLYCFQIYVHSGFRVGASTVEHGRVLDLDFDDLGDAGGQVVAHAQPPYKGVTTPLQGGHDFLEIQNGRKRVMTPYNPRIEGGW